MKITSTPWGRPDNVEIIADGIAFVSTPSHGGFVLSAERAAKIPAVAKPYAGDRRYWEEDGDWAVPYVVFNAEMAGWSSAKYNGPTKMMRYARGALKCAGLTVEDLT